MYKNKTIAGGGGIQCSWFGFYDRESNICQYRLAVGVKEGDDSVFGSITLPPHTTDYLIPGKTKLTLVIGVFVETAVETCWGWSGGYCKNSKALFNLSLQHCKTIHAIMCISISWICNTH